MPKPSQYDDYDKEPVPERARPKPMARPAKGGGDGRALLTILLLVGGAVLVVLLLCGGLGYFLASWPTSTTSQSVVQQMSPEELQEARRKWKQKEAAATTDQERAGAFLEYWLAELCANSLDDAHRRTTKAFQARQPRAAFGKWVQNNPDLKQVSPVWTYGLTLKGPKYTFVLEGHTPPYHLVATREEGEWKVDDIYIIGQR